MPTRREQDPLPIQYLGESGHTYPCVRAMVTILTSPYRCRAITIVFREQPRGEDSTDVCFVIWDWLGCEITIVPDGFGTHSGTGGWGLALVLALIQFYQIPLLEKWVNPDQFERISNGYPTARDRQLLHQPDFGAPSWPYYQQDFVSRLWSQIQREASQFPYWLVEPELLDDIKDLERNPGGAVFQAVRRLEILTRDIGAYPAERIGQPLVNEAMGTGRPLEPHGATPDERIAWANLFRGVIGAFKNPESHRDQQLKLEDAIGQILAVNGLLRKLKQDFPDRFWKEEHTSSEGDEDEEALPHPQKGRTPWRPENP